MIIYLIETTITNNSSDSFTATSPDGGTSQKEYALSYPCENGKNI